MAKILEKGKERRAKGEEQESINPKPYALSSMLLATRSVLEKAKESSTWLKIVFGAKISLILFLLGLIYHPTFIWMWQRWFAADSYYAHGPLIPVVSGVLIWLRRRELARTPVMSSDLGLGFLLTGLLLHIISTSTRVHFSSAYSLFVVLLGLVIYFFGRKFTRVILFPLCFLLFMIPAPMAVVEATTLKMKLSAAHISVSIIQLLGISAVREGSMVYMPNTSIVVGDPCSGLRSLISLSALGILYAYIVRASYPRKVSLFLISIPVAIIANMIRTTATLLIANSYGDKIVTEGFLHKGFGLMVFIIAFAGLFLAGRLLGCRVMTHETGDMRLETGDMRQVSLKSKVSSLKSIIAVILLSVTAFITFGAYSTRSHSGALYTQDIPMIIGGWYSSGDIPMDERTYEILETRDAFMREYVNSSNEKVLLTVVFARDNRKVAHPPEVCFSGSGWSTTDRDIQTVAVGSQMIKVNRLILQKDAEKQVVLYLYKAGGKLTPNYYAQQFNIILNGMLRKNTSSALIRISSFANGDDAEEAMERMKKFTGEVIPILEEHLP